MTRIAEQRRRCGSLCGSRCLIVRRGGRWREAVDRSSAGYLGTTLYPRQPLYSLLHAIHIRRCPWNSNKFLR